MIEQIRILTSLRLLSIGLNSCMFSMYRIIYGPVFLPILMSNWGVFGSLNQTKANGVT